MRAQDIVSTKALKLTHTEVASNKIPYLGQGFFPNVKKAGIDLKQIRTAKGLPVTLNPSAYDTVSTIRSREGFKLDETQMAFFKESTLVKERDRVELLRIQDATDPYAVEVYKSIFNDFESLYDSAEVTEERMRMQLLASPEGHPSISLKGDNATYEYDYDPEGEYAAKNFVELLTTSKWSDTANSDPIADVKRAMKALKKERGAVPSYLLINDNTMDLLVANTKVRQYILAQNTTALVNIDEDTVANIFKLVAKIQIIVYDKAFKNENGETENFYPDGYATLLPAGTLGNTYHGTTPAEVDMLNGETVDTEVFDEKVTVTVTHTTDPSHTKTTAEMVCLPSFEQMFETYTIKAY